MIEIKNLIFSNKKQIIINIENLVIKNNEKIALLGLNGAGKTTLSEIILNIKKKYLGEVKRNPNIKFNAVFQDSSFLSDFSLNELFKLYCNLYNISEDSNYWFAKFDLLQVKSNIFKKTSAGQQQKFKFLIAMLNKPNFLVLDEISTSLDYVWRKKVLDLINQEILTQKMNILLISHDPEEIASICDRIIFLKKGQIEIDFKLTGSYVERLKKIKEVMKKHV